MTGLCVQVSLHSGEMPRYVTVRVFPHEIDSHNPQQQQLGTLNYWCIITITIRTKATATPSCRIFIYYWLLISRGSDSSLSRAPDSWSQGCGFDTRKKRQENFLVLSYFLCWLLFGVRSIPVQPQCHVTDCGHSAKSAGGRLHLNMHTPFTKRSRNGLIMFFWHSAVESLRKTNSRTTGQGTLVYSRLRSLSQCGLIVS